MNIKDLKPGSYEVVEENKPMNINDLAPDSYEVVEDNFQERLKREAEKVEQLKKESKDSALESAVVGASTFGDMVGAKHAAAGIQGAYDRVTGDKSSIVQAYLDRKRAIEAQRNKAYEDNPVPYVGGAIASGLATAGPAIKGAQALGGGIKGAIGAGAIEGAATGLGASEAEDLEGLAKDAALGGTIGGAIPAATAGVSKTVKAVPELIPGARPNSIGNEVAATLSPRRLLPGTTKQDLLDYYNNPKLRQQVTKTDTSNEISKMSGQLGEEMSKADEAVGRVYRELEDVGTKGITEASDGLLDSTIQTIKQNPGAYSPKVQKTVRIAKKFADGEMGLTEGKEVGERVLKARRHLDNGIGDFHSLSRDDKELIKTARQELQDILRTSPEMVEADDTFKGYMKTKKDLESKIFSGKGPDKAVDAEKLRRAMTTTTLKGEAFEESLSTYSKFIESNPKLANNSNIKAAKESLDKLKEVIDIGQLEYKLSKSGGPTAEAVFLLMQSAASTVLGPAAFIALPLVNPTVWGSIVDAAGPKAAGLIKTIEKATPVIRSAAVREVVKQKKEKN